MSIDDEPHKSWHEFIQNVNKLEQKQASFFISPPKIRVNPRSIALPDLPTISEPIPAIDRKFLRKIKNGSVKIDRTFDLHGLTATMARQLLGRVITESFMKNQKLLLIVTGKGVNNQGILRQNLPLWLEEVEIRPFIAGFGSSAIEHGGEGAFYLVLKKNKTSNLGVNFLF